MRCWVEERNEVPKIEVKLGRGEGGRGGEEGGRGEEGGIPLGRYSQLGNPRHPEFTSQFILLERKFFIHFSPSIYNNNNSSRRNVDSSSLIKDDFFLENYNNFCLQAKNWHTQKHFFRCQILSSILFKRKKIVPGSEDRNVNHLEF